MNKNKYNKRWIYKALYILPLFVITAILIYYINFKTVAIVNVRTEPIIIEYGQTIDCNTEKFIQLDNISFIKNSLNKTPKDILDKINVYVGDIKYIDGTNYPSVGKHTVTLNVVNNEKKLKIYFNEHYIKQDITIIVKDSVEPNFIEFKDTIETNKDIHSTTNNIKEKKETTKTHKINQEVIINTGYYFDDFNLVHCKNIYKCIVEDDSRKVYFSGNVYEIINNFYNMTQYSVEEVELIFNIKVPYSNDKALENEKGKYLLIDENYFLSVKNMLINKQNDYLKHRIIYRDTIVDALKKMNLYCSDREMVRQINDWICQRISYKSTDNPRYWELFSIDNNMGYCSHYAILFNDMCRAVGIQSIYVSGYTNGKGHAWNSVEINDNWYYIDVTWNDTTNNAYYLTEKLWSDHKKR